MLSVRSDGSLVPAHGAAIPVIFAGVRADSISAAGAGRRAARTHWVAACVYPHRQFPVVRGDAVVHDSVKVVIEVRPDDVGMVPWVQAELAMSQDLLTLTLPALIGPFCVLDSLLLGMPSHPGALCCDVGHGASPLASIGEAA